MTRDDLRRIAERHDQLRMLARDKLKPGTPPPPMYEWVLDAMEEAVSEETKRCALFVQDFEYDDSMLYDCDSDPVDRILEDCAAALRGSGDE